MHAAFYAYRAKKITVVPSSTYRESDITSASVHEIRYLESVPESLVFLMANQSLDKAQGETVLLTRLSCGLQSQINSHVSRCV